MYLGLLFTFAISAFAEGKLNPHEAGFFSLPNPSEVQFSPDSKYLVGNSTEGHIKIATVPEMKVLFDFQQTGYLYSVVFDPKGRFVVTGTSQAKNGFAEIRLHDFSTLESRTLMKRQTLGSVTATMTSDGKFLLVGISRYFEGEESEIKVFEVASWREVFSQTSPDLLVFAIASPDDAEFLVDPYSDLRVIDVKTWKMRKIGGAVNCHSADWKNIVLEKGREHYFYDFAKDRTLEKVETDFLNCSFAAAGSKMVAFSHEERRSDIYDVGTRKKTTSVNMLGAVGADNEEIVEDRWIALYSRAKLALRIADLEGKVLADFEVGIPYFQIYGSVLLADRYYAFYDELTSVIPVADLKDKSMMFIELDDGFESTSISAFADRYLVTTNFNIDDQLGQLAIYDSNGWKKIYDFRVAVGFNEAVVSPDGRYVAAGTYKGPVKLFSMY